MAATSDEIFLILESYSQHNRKKIDVLNVLACLTDGWCDRVYLFIFSIFESLVAYKPKLISKCISPCAKHVVELVHLPQCL